ncbi:MAG: hypothetical protein KatS3mg129_1580 [Leptospiraceae bacterium]|nr:MAG: hypothetical protein KatS3mg129_1580 [Leptospiraceae bacterium]
MGFCDFFNKNKDKNKENQTLLGAWLILQSQKEEVGYCDQVSKSDPDNDGQNTYMVFLSPSTKSQCENENQQDWNTLKQALIAKIDEEFANDCTATKNYIQSQNTFPNQINATSKSFFRTGSFIEESKNWIKSLYNVDDTLVSSLKEASLEQSYDAGLYLFVYNYSLPNYANDSNCKTAVETKYKSKYPPSQYLDLANCRSSTFYDNCNNNTLNNGHIIFQTGCVYGDLQVGSNDYSSLKCSTLNEQF